MFVIISMAFYSAISNIFKKQNFNLQKNDANRKKSPDRVPDILPQQNTLQGKYTSFVRSEQMYQRFVVLQLFSFC